MTSPKKRWRLWRQLAKMKLWGALALLAPPKALKLLRETKP
jgi:hypothetical protein